MVGEVQHEAAGAAGQDRGDREQPQPQSFGLSGARLGDSSVRGFLGEIDGNSESVFVHKDGPYQGKLASSSVPTPNQLLKWGVN